MLNVFIVVFIVIVDVEICEEIILWLFDGEVFVIFLYGFDCFNIYLVFVVKDFFCKQILDFVGVWFG